MGDSHNNDKKNYLPTHKNPRGRDRAVGIEIRYGLDGAGVDQQRNGRECVGNYLTIIDTEM